MRRLSAILLLLACGVAAGDELVGLIEQLGSSDPELRAAAEAEILARGEPVRADLQACFEALGPEEQFRVEILFDKLDAAATGLAYEELAELEGLVEQYVSVDAKERRTLLKDLTMRLRGRPLPDNPRGTRILLEIVFPLFEDRTFRYLLPALCSGLDGLDAETSAALDTMPATTRIAALLAVAMATGEAEILRADVEELLAAETFSEVSTEVAHAIFLLADPALHVRLLERCLAGPYELGPLAVLAFSDALPEEWRGELAQVLLACSDEYAAKRTVRNTVRGNLYRLLAPHDYAEVSAVERLAADDVPGLPCDWPAAPLYLAVAEADWTGGEFRGRLTLREEPSTLLSGFLRSASFEIQLARNAGEGQVCVLRTSLNTRTTSTVTLAPRVQVRDMRTQYGAAGWHAQVLTTAPDPGLGALETEAAVYSLALAYSAREIASLVSRNVVPLARVESRLALLQPEQARGLALQLAPQSETARVMLRGIARDGEDPVHRFEALAVLAQCGDPVALEGAEQLFAEGRTAAVVGLLDDLAVSPALEIEPGRLLPFLRSSSPGLRAQAVRLLEHLSGELPAVTPPPLAERVEAWIERLEAPDEQP